MRPVPRLGLAAALAASALAIAVALAVWVPPAPVRQAAATGPGPAGTGTPKRAGPAASAGVAIDAGRFSPGACVGYPPTAGDRHLTVFLDAGHGGPDPGAVGTTRAGKTIYEANQTLPVVLDAMSLLRRDGFRVVVSRTHATSVLRLRPGDASGHELTPAGSHADIAARDACANLAHASLLVGVYFDAAQSPATAGCLTGYDQARSFATANRRFAGLLQADVLAAMNRHGWRIPDDGVQPDQNLGSALTPADLAYGHLVLLGPAKRGYFSTPSQMPGALIEPLFITDPAEGSIAASTVGQHVIAGGVAAAITQYFDSTARPQLGIESMFDWT
jgi:N-acetylmuramoyl-L-alanine amidase